jgi:SAM-dependent methyltransferase
MALRLNLGCGRAQFPTTRENPFTAHQLYAVERHLPAALDSSAEWVNVDSAPIEGVDKVMDLFTYPWAFADNSVDEIFCSHIIEHIPHDAKVRQPRTERREGVYIVEIDDSILIRAAKLDGWYAFFYEAWRILKPDGKIHIIAPYGWSSGAMHDPTHTRLVAPGCFGYFSPNPDAPFDYQIPARFEQVSNEVRVTDIGRRLVEEFGDEHGFMVALRTIDAISEFYIGLRAVK